MSHGEMPRKTVFEAFGEFQKGCGDAVTFSTLLRGAWRLHHVFGTVFPEGDVDSIGMSTLVGGILHFIPQIDHGAIQYRYSSQQQCIVFCSTSQKRLSMVDI